MSRFLGDLNLDELARRCRQESERYLAGRPHGEAYCFKLFRRAIFARDQATSGAIYTQYQPLVSYMQQLRAVSYLFWIVRISSIC